MSILDDTWNSNPSSLRAAFQTLNSLAKGRKRVALIGYISALGDSTLDIHRQVGDMITELGVDVLITIGSTTEVIAKQTLKNGLKGESYSFPNNQGVIDFLKRILDQNTILLVKSSMRDPLIKNLLGELKVR